MIIKKIFTNVRVVILLLFVLFAVVSISPSFTRDGVAIRNVLQNSSVSLAGIQNPNPAASPMSREVIKSINNIPISGIEDYFSVISSLEPNITINIQTNKDVYYVSSDSSALGLTVYDAPTSNLRKGLDLEGGTRVLLQPKEKISSQDMSMLIDSMKQRLNVYGLSDLIVRESNDLPPPLGTGNQYIVVEIAGATEEEVKNLLASQGKFEAKISNLTAFTGGNDITSVCRSPECAGIDPRQGCQQLSDGWMCGFRFSITLSQEAANSQAELTKNLKVITLDNRQYLEEKLMLFLDGKEVNQLSIGSDLKGRAVTGIEISGTGTGSSREEAVVNALKEMKSMQTLLITGSLPVEIELVKTDTISPILGGEFIRNALLVGIFALLSVAAVIFIRYRKIKVSMLIVTTMICELIIVLGIASVIGWNLDLAAIAGIIIAIGTGVDHQIVITDETLGKATEDSNWKARLKRALFIIFTAYATTIVAMVPLFFAGAGLLKGFAITSMIGASIGVFITRPAYASLLEITLKNEN